MTRADAFRGAVLETLRAIDRVAERLGYAPTVREVCRERVIASPSTVHRHLSELRDAGLVSWSAGASRTLVVTSAGHEALA